MKEETSQPFSHQLEAWLRSNKPKTLLSLDKVFAEKSFAVMFIILLAIPSLPVPTGGISHVFEIVAILIGLQVVAGRRSLWLPKRWRRLSVGKTMRSKVMPTLVRLIRWFEKYSRPRFVHLMHSSPLIWFFGLAVIVFSVSAFLSPPFSGLDTLPAMGAVLMSLAIVLEDFLLFLLGAVIGSVGIGLTIFIGKTVVDLFSGFL